jgi:hypothetical protein
MIPLNLPSRFRPLISLLILFVALSLVRAAAAQCPMSTVSAHAWPEVVDRTSSAPSDTVARAVASTDPQNPTCTASAAASYNLVLGTVSAYASAARCAGQAAASTHDVFTLIGPPSNGPFTFAARGSFNLQGYCSIGGYPGSASVSIGGVRAAVGCDGPWQGPLYIDYGITCSPGDTFDLEMGATAYSSTPLPFQSIGSATMTLSFPDLPAGYAVVSCQGFTTGQPVPASVTSWGHLKLVYR